MGGRSDGTDDPGHGAGGDAELLIGAPGVEGAGGGLLGSDDLLITESGDLFASSLSA